MYASMCVCVCACALYLVQNRAGRRLPVVGLRSMQLGRWVVCIAACACVAVTSYCAVRCRIQATVVLHVSLLCVELLPNWAMWG